VAVVVAGAAVTVQFKVASWVLCALTSIAVTHSTPELALGLNCKVRQFPVWHRPSGPFYKLFPLAPLEQQRAAQHRWGLYLAQSVHTVYKASLSIGKHAVLPVRRHLECGELASDSGSVPTTGHTGEGGCSGAAVPRCRADGDRCPGFFCYSTYYHTSLR
jgi:hypothetical protein